MVLEYLIVSEQIANECKAIINNAEIECNYKKLGNSYIVVSAYHPSNSIETAKKLSDLNDQITQLGEIKTLANESAAYFNKVLFPIINDFERKLRKLLYATTAIVSGIDGQETIQNLESKDLGELFNLLFLDIGFQRKIKDYVKNGNGKGWNGFQSELLEFLDGEKECPLWDRLLKEKVPSLRNQFNEVRSIRNDVMHAHNINKDTYNKARKLFERINKELSDTTTELANGAFVLHAYDNEIEEAIAYSDLYEMRKFEKHLNNENNEEPGNVRKTIAESYAESIRVRQKEAMLKQIKPVVYEEYITEIITVEQEMNEMITEVERLQKIREKSRTEELQLIKLQIKIGERAKFLLDKENILDKYLSFAEK